MELRILMEEKGEVVVLKLQGEITKTSGEELLNYASLGKKLPAGLKVLVVNFIHVDYINSAGLAYLIRVSKLLHEQQVEICSFGLEEHYEKMFCIVGLNKFMKFYPSEWSAIDDL